ncbi:hypothetical protein DL766_004565 [Monosporascus sp. MC13-8B]|uniref:Iron-sulfur cluster assembly factor IBA57 homolog, mitochondrial n=1 Tax=Monosporascus cannonballus TaxID=155416 RepID=A0ABY0GWE0_9PEZI|nr:hypothetical protein DL762_008381 [Monosporascus cannonballus]RYO83224.1 hypothetical protein DL763_007957 [Monosporascus cannonballus]RYP31045.1 hypothetical protein DL766_004565 [Monosporascus sp. MC13-8B]
MQTLPRRIARPTASPKARSWVACPSCRTSQRLPAFSYAAALQPSGYASYTSSAPYPQPPPKSGSARLTSRRLISIGGVDAPKFLQGIITSSILNLEQGFYSGFLNATGRVLHDVFIYRDTLRVGVAAGDPTLDANHAFIIEVDAPQLDALMKHLKRYMLRSKFKIQAIGEDQCTVWQVWDDSKRSNDSEASAPLSLDQEGAVVLQDNRAPGLGYRVVSTRLSGPQVDLEQSDDTAYRIRRYLLGVPEGQGEIFRGGALPLETNMDLMGGIDFRKGCYVGQELTIRTKHRGVVRKRILPCVLYGGDEAAPPQLEYNPAAAAAARDQALAAENIPAGLSIGRHGKKGRSAGNWLRGAGNIGLALCRLQVMTDIQLPGETATAPFDPNDEFEMRLDADEGGEGGKAVKVKAFVPEWLRARLDQSNTSH